MRQTNTMTIIVFTDGGARGNPGPAATGIVIFKLNNTAHLKTISSPHDIELDKPLAELSTHLGETTNNVAEWAAIVEAAEWINEFAPDDEVLGFLDSQLVQRQIEGIYKVKDLKMKSFKVKFDNLFKGRKYRFIHIERELNSLADELVNKTLDEYSN